MLLRKKKRIHKLLDAVLDILNILNRLQDKKSAFMDCIGVIHAVLEELKKEKMIPTETISQLKIVKNNLHELMEKNILTDLAGVDDLMKGVKIAQSILKKEVRVKLNIVFLPYKVTMWDSLETIYAEALRDPECEVKVVPIPYYELSRTERTFRYEGDQFPKEVHITHYSQFNLEEEEPDIIFVHNIYDQYNTITQVSEEYFTSNLKKYTDMLVFVPYHISSFINNKGTKYLAYSVPTIKNVDKVILSSEHVKEAAIRDGVPQEKLLVLGSPKFDHIVNAMKEGIEYPEGWEEKLEGKTVFTLNTGCLFFANHSYHRVSLLSNLLNIPSIAENSVLIWRPHPLTRASIKQYTPDLLSYYDILVKEYLAKEFIYKNVIFDETEDYLPALIAADVLITVGDGSLLRAYLATGKKVIFVHNDIPVNPSFFSNSIIPSKGFYYYYNQDEPWQEIVKKMANGDDSLKEHRRDLLERSYVNTDGTCGAKVYRAIKEHVLSKNMSIL